MFASWNQKIEQKLESLKTDFFGGEKVGVADILLFSLYRICVQNHEHTRFRELTECWEKCVDDTPSVKNWLQKMTQIFKEYTDKEPNYYI